MPVQLRYIQLNTDKANAADLSSGVFAIFTRDSIYAVARICHANSVRLFVRLSHACIVSKLLNVSSKFFYRLRIIQVFRHQESLCKSDSFTPNGSTKYKGGSNFRPICGYISERVLDKDIVTKEDGYKVVCALSNSVTFDYPE